MARRLAGVGLAEDVLDGLFNCWEGKMGQSRVRCVESWGNIDGTAVGMDS